MSLRRPLGIALLVVATPGCLLLGTLGWFVIRFGILTDCTNDDSCTTTGCDPCDGAARWVNADGAAQWVLAVSAVVVLVRDARGRRRGGLLVPGLAVLVLSVTAVAGTTWAADLSYCRPGTPGYAGSHCPVDR